MKPVTLGSVAFSVLALCVMSVPPTEPLCEDPVFIEEGSAALLSCTSDRVYHAGICNFHPLAPSNLSGEFVIETRNFDSTRYPGNKKVTCELRVPVGGNSAGEFRFQVEITPSEAPNMSVFAATPALHLAPIQFNGEEDGHSFTFPASGDLKLDIPVTGSPAVNRVTLLFRASGSSDIIPVSSLDFRWHYERTVGSGAGLVQLFLPNARKTVDIRHYIVKADNGMIADVDFQYKFSAVFQIEGPTQPICKEPVFEDGGALAVMTCTSDRILPPFNCQFQTIYDSIEITKDFDSSSSITYPGYDKAACALRMTVTGSRAGDYQFEVVFTSKDAYESQRILTHKVSLRPTELYYPEENHHVFVPQTSGNVIIDILVAGNPPPNRVTLWLRNGESSNRVPVSHTYFRWHYARTVGSEVGIFHLNLTVGWKTDGVRAYTLKVENGVFLEDEFEYYFTVEQEPTADTRMLPIIIGASVGGLVLVGVIVIILWLANTKRAKRSSEHDRYSLNPGGISGDIGFFYPNMGCDLNRQHGHNASSSSLTGSYLQPLPEENEHSEIAEYIEIYDNAIPETRN